MGLRNPCWGVVCAGVSLLASAAVANAATIAVPAGGNLQAALNAAQAGDVIALAPGATYIGNFVLPNKGAITDFITLRSAAPDSALPPPGIRMTPAYAAMLPKIRSSNSMSALRTATAANHWRLLFLEFQANLNGYGDVIALGAGDSSQTQLSQVPYALVIDRVYIHGDPVLGQKRGLALHSNDTTIINSYISECKGIGQDTQAIGGFNGPGNYLIENNYLEGATENIMLGGSDPTIPNLVTTNVTFRRNHLRKPLAWRDPIIASPASPAAQPVGGGGTLAAGTYYYRVAARAAAGQTNKATSSASTEVLATIAAGTTGGVTISWTPVVGADEYLVYGRTTSAENVYWKTTNPYFTDTGTAGTAGTPSSSGTRWAVKNIFELKNAQDVIVEGNVFENIWVADQTGYAVVFTPRNQGGRAPWVVVQRITFQHNLVRHAAGGVNILGTDNVAPSQRTTNITVRDNVFDDLTAATWGTGSRPFIIGNGPDAVTIDHNTVITTDTAFIWLYGGLATSPTAATNTVITNNMTTHNAYGIMGSDVAFGAATIAAYLPGSIISRNVLAGGSASRYPTGNFFPTVPVWQAGFVAFAAADYHLMPSSAYRAAATDGSDLGANIDAINAQTAIALSGDNTIPPGVNRVRIIQTALPDGVLNQSYAETLICTGGSGPCAWRVHDSTMPAGLAFDTVAALVSGIPSQLQTGQLVVEAFDPSWPSNTATATLSITINPPPFVVTIPAAPAAQVGAPYELTPIVSGAIGSPTWSIASGSLPSGVTIDPSSGVIRGVPEAWSTFTALVQAQDSWGTNRIDAKPVTVTVAPTPLSIDTTSLAPATYRMPYSASVSAHGGTGQTTWSIVGGALPDGVTLDATGGLNGTPAAIGTFTTTVQAQDVQWPGNVATRPVVLTVDPPPFSIALPASPPARVGQSYQLNATATGNVGVVAWRIASGALASGLTLDGVSGVISGTPTAWGLFTVLVQGTDGWGEGRVDLKTLKIEIAPLPLAVSTTTLSSANVNRSYQATLGATGGTGQTTWTVSAGSLPAGLSLSANGVISGTPTTVGVATFTVQASDAGWSGNIATRALSLSVGAREIVLYASDASRIAGTWSMVADATAAGGFRIANPDAAAAKLATPLANPANYFEITFQVEAGVAYHLWMRGKADKNAWANDSVYVQFSGTVNATGAPINRIGTTSATPLSIEDGVNAGLSGWGWADDSYGGFASPLSFAASGPQTIRVQVREDGLSLDQIVLSSVTYATAAPGATKNDTTRLPR